MNVAAYGSPGLQASAGEAFPVVRRVGSIVGPNKIGEGGRFSGVGAWEVGVRYSDTSLDFDPGLPGLAPPIGGIRGGRQKVWTIGLNWYRGYNVKLMLDYQHAEVDRLNPAGPDNPEPFGSGEATPPIGVQVGQTLDMFSSRMQFAF
jgi:phosphate-selective porin OprO/OprP